MKRGIGPWFPHTQSTWLDSAHWSLFCWDVWPPVWDCLTDIRFVSLSRDGNKTGSIRPIGQKGATWAAELRKRGVCSNTKGLHKVKHSEECKDKWEPTLPLKSTPAVLLIQTTSDDGFWPLGAAEASCSTWTHYLMLTFIFGFMFVAISYISI